MEMPMRICQLLCVGLALLLSSCASWHRPDTVYRGKKGSAPPAIESPDEAPFFTANEADRPNEPQVFDLDSPTLTPPVQGVSHRTGYRGEPERARPVRTERPAPHPPGLGYIELPPPPDLK